MCVDGVKDVLFITSNEIFAMRVVVCVNSGNCTGSVMKAADGVH